MLCKQNHRGLLNADAWGFFQSKSDPYCVCQVKDVERHTHETRFQTRVIRNDLNPIWNHKATIIRAHPNAPLEFQIWDKDIFAKSDQLIGVAVLDSSEFHDSGFEGELTLSGHRATGFLTVKVKALGDA